MRRLFFFGLVMTLLTLAACDNNPDAVDTSKTSDELLQEYFVANNITPSSTGSGLYYTIEEAGSAEKPTANSDVTVHYRGTLLNGEQFDSSYDRGAPSTFNLQQVIRGWTEGIQLFGRGGQGKLYIPSSLGYGNRSVGGIPANSPLIFEVEVLDF